MCGLTRYYLLKCACEKSVIALIATGHNILISSYHHFINSSATSSTPSSSATHIIHQLHHNIIIIKILSVWLVMNYAKNWLVPNVWDIDSHQCKICNELWQISEVDKNAIIRIFLIIFFTSAAGLMMDNMGKSSNYIILFLSLSNIRFSKVALLNIFFLNKSFRWFLSSYCKTACNNFSKSNFTFECECEKLKDYL